MVEAPTITEITMSGPGAGGVETATAVLGDVVSILSGEAPVHAAARAARGGHATSARPSTCTSRSPTAPASSPRIADVLGRNEISVQSVVQRGLGDDARLVMVMHEAPGGAPSTRRSSEIAELDFLRAAPRAIRVIEEEFA